MRPKTQPDYSFRNDQTVPEFDETRIVLVMDGNCAICSGAARRITRWDQKDQVRIATVTSPLGSSLLAHYGLNPEDPASWLMIRDGRAYVSFDAMLRLGGTLKPAFRVFNLFRILPRPAQDWLYARLARNRYALFGHDDLCALPDDALRHRLVG